MLRTLLTILILNTFVYVVFSQDEKQLISEIKGNWITTIIPDTIQLNKKILPWKDIFYGFMQITIKDDSTIIISGNVDQGEHTFKVVDSNTIEIKQLENFKITYSKDKDLIFLGTVTPFRVFRRIIDNNLINIIKDENKLMKYIIKMVFSDYLTNEDVMRIEYISLGLETYTPFTFDAIGIKNNNNIKVLLCMIGFISSYVYSNSHTTFLLSHSLSLTNS